MLQVRLRDRLFFKTTCSYTCVTSWQYSFYNTIARLTTRVSIQVCDCILCSSYILIVLTEKGIIQPSTSACASPIVLVPKQDKTVRFCVDYQNVNAVTKKDVYPLPRIDDILDTHGRRRYFSGFWQIKMDPASRDKSASPPTAGFMSLSGCHSECTMPWQPFKG